GLSGKRLITGNMSASNTALPRIRAATATDTEPSGEILVPFNISTRINATMCKATKKKIVGGSNAKNSSLSLVNSLVMELNCHESLSVSWFWFLVRFDLLVSWFAGEFAAASCNTARVFHNRKDN